jgi:isopenicillin N synthase-like dioxygenase
MTSTDTLTSIPTLNYALLSSPDTRAVFIQQLRHALVDVGFLYLEHPPVPDAVFDEVIAYLPRVFGLPQERKDALRMANSPHFLGYSRLGVEMTKGVADQREQFDLATPFENGWVPGEPEYLRLWGPSQVGSLSLAPPPPPSPSPSAPNPRPSQKRVQTVGDG